MSQSKSRYHGKSRHRLKDNPLEKAFADAWDKHNRDPFGRYPDWFNYYSDPARGESDASVRERVAANSVVQWLGSPVGEGFLADVLSSPAAENLRERIARRVSERRGLKPGSKNPCQMELDLETSP